MISGQSLTCPKGTSLTFEIDMDTGSDLTGATAQWALAESWFDKAKVYLTKTGTGDGLFIGQDAGVWKITVNLAPTDTLDIPSGLLYHDCKVLLQSGDVEDVANGPFSLDPSVNILDTNAPITRNLHSLQALGRPSQVVALTVGALARNLLASQSLGGLAQAATASDAIVWDDASKVPVIIFAGESNAGGAVSNTGIPTTAHPDVKILNNTSLVFESLQIGVNNLIDHAGATDNSTHGWELELANKAASNTFGTSPVYLIKNGQGGSVIAQWGLSDTYMNKFTDRWNAAVTALTALGKTPYPILWLSIGENDELNSTDTLLFRLEYMGWIGHIRSLIGFCPAMLTHFTPTYSAWNTYIDNIVANNLWTYAIDTTAANAFIMAAPEHWDEGGMTILADAMTEISVDPTKVGLGSAYAANKATYMGSPTGAMTVWDRNAKGTLVNLWINDQDADTWGGAFTSVRGTNGKTGGKFYFEVKVFAPCALSGGGIFIGLMDATTTSAASLDTFAPNFCGMARDDTFAAAQAFTVVGTTGLGAIAGGDVIGCAADVTAQKMWLSKNNTWVSSGDPAGGTNPYFTWGFTQAVFPAAAFTQPWQRLRLQAATTTFTPPSGFSVWG